MKKFTEMYIKMQSMVKDEKGATMVEYALMVALIAVASVLAVTGLGQAVSGMFTNITGSI